MSEDEAWAFLRGWLMAGGEGARFEVRHDKSFDGKPRYHVSVFNPASGYWESAEKPALASAVVDVAAKLSSRLAY